MKIVLISEKDLQGINPVHYSRTTFSGDSAILALLELAAEFDIVEHSSSLVGSIGLALKVLLWSGSGLM